MHKSLRCHSKHVGIINQRLKNIGDREFLNDLDSHKCMIIYITTLIDGDLDTIYFPIIGGFHVHARTGMKLC